MSYPGLPRGTVDFLAGLAAHNEKPWFDARRAEYERDWKAAGLDLVAALAPFAEAAMPRLSAVPKIGGALRRIHRDTRFSADKRPYEPQLHIALTLAGAAHAGVHLVVQPDRLAFGAGEWMLDPLALARFRARVQGAEARAALLAAVAEAEAAGSRWDAPDLRRLPSGTTADPDWEHLLRRKSVILRGEMPLPDWLFTPQAVPELTRLAAAHLPLLAWLSAG
jgi:uncharacterized protein (TIGR02453 family)